MNFYVVDSVEGRTIIKAYIDSGYICPACTQPISEEDLSFSEAKGPFHTECLKA